MQQPEPAAQELVLSFILHRIQRKARLPENALLTTDYVDEGYVDSMELISFVADIESEFGVRLTAEDILSTQFRTAGGLAALLARKMG